VIDTLARVYIALGLFLLVAALATTLIALGTPPRESSTSASQPPRAILDRATREAPAQQDMSPGDEDR
jgi:hypothetical protein